MKLDDAVCNLLNKDMRRIDSSWHAFKLTAYTIKYDTETIVRIDIHVPKQNGGKNQVV